LRTVEGTLYSTFQEAANKHGLLKNENRFIDALIEATGWATGSGLKKLYSFPNVLQLSKVRNEFLRSSKKILPYDSQW
jgi:hypothetical protein